MGANHRGAHVLVAQELLDGADVMARFEQVGGEGTAEGVVPDVKMVNGVARFEGAKVAWFSDHQSGVRNN